MATLNRYEVLAILEHLDDALVSLRLDDAGRLLRESNATWRVRLAREKLLNVAVQPIEIEMLEAA